MCIDEEIKRLYLEGLSERKIACFLDISRNEVRDSLDELEVKRRTKSQANIGKRKYTLDETVFDTITEESAYWIGFLAADGCVMPQPYGQCAITLTLSAVDINHLYKFADFLKTDKPVRIYKQLLNGVEREYVHINVFSDHICNSLINLGITPRKSKTLMIHDVLVYNPHFWRGVIDGDGCVYFNKAGYKYIHLSGSSFLLEQFLLFLNSIHPTKASVRPADGTFQVCITAKNYIDNIYIDDAKYYLDRKFAKAKENL